MSSAALAKSIADTISRALEISVDPNSIKSEIERSVSGSGSFDVEKYLDSFLEKSIQNSKWLPFKVRHLPLLELGVEKYLGRVPPDRLQLFRRAVERLLISVGGELRFMVWHEFETSSDRHESFDKLSDELVEAGLGKFEISMLKGVWQKLFVIDNKEGMVEIGVENAIGSPISIISSPGKSGALGLFEKEFLRGLMKSGFVVGYSNFLPEVSDVERLDVIAGDRKGALVLVGDAVESVAHDLDLVQYLRKDFLAEREGGMRRIVLLTNDDGVRSDLKSHVKLILEDAGRSPIVHVESVGVGGKSSGMMAKGWLGFLDPLPLEGFDDDEDSEGVFGLAGALEMYGSTLGSVPTNLGFAAVVAPKPIP